MAKSLDDFAVRAEEVDMNAYSPITARFGKGGPLLHAWSAICFTFMFVTLDQTVNPPALPPTLGQAQSQSGWANRRRPFFFRPRVVGIAAVVLLGVA
jgi:hypothetical protein